MTMTTSPPSPASKPQPSTPQACNHSTRTPAGASTSSPARFGARGFVRRQQRKFLHNHRRSISSIRSGVHAARFFFKGHPHSRNWRRFLHALMVTRAPAPDLRINTTRHRLNTGLVQRSGITYHSHGPPRCGRSCLHLRQTELLTRSPCAVPALRGGHIHPTNRPPRVQPTAAIWGTNLQSSRP